MNNLTKLSLVLFLLLNLGNFYSLRAYNYSSISSPPNSSTIISQDPVNVESGDITAVQFNSATGTSTAQFQKIDNCSSVTSNSINFLDDGLEGDYYDGISRSDTVEICATQGSVNLVFTEFGLAVGDTLFVFQGNLDSLRQTESPNLDYGTGVGVFKAFGGWVFANCLNNSGCLTFIFQTNGDNISNSGWKSWWDCSGINEVLDCPEDKIINSSFLPEDTGIPILNKCNVDTMYYMDSPFQIDCSTYADFTRNWFIY